MLLKPSGSQIDCLWIKIFILLLKLKNHLHVHTWDLWQSYCIAKANQSQDSQAGADKPFNGQQQWDSFPTATATTFSVGSKITASIYFHYVLRHSNSIPFSQQKQAGKNKQLSDLPNSPAYVWCLWHIGLHTYISLEQVFDGRHTINKQNSKQINKNPITKQKQPSIT